MPSVTTRLTFFLVLAAAGFGHDVRIPYLMAFARAFAGACIGVGALAAQRQATTMAQAAVAAQIHQALDRHADFAAQVAFDHELADFGAGARLPAPTGRGSWWTNSRRRLRRPAWNRYGQCRRCFAKPTQTCFWAGRLTPAIRAMRRSPMTKARAQGARRGEHEILIQIPVFRKSRTRRSQTRHGECAHAPAPAFRTGSGTGFAFAPPRATPARTGCHPRPEPLTS